MRISVRPVADSDRPWVLDVIRHWVGDFVITRGRKVYPADIGGLVAENEAGERVGLATYEIVGDQCELVTLDTLVRFAGVGSTLIDRIRNTAIEAGCRRLWLITTNDNTDAMRFYQRRGFALAAAHVGAIAESRRIKPSIPEIGMNGIAIRDEIEFEMML